MKSCGPAPADLHVNAVYLYNLNTAVKYICDSGYSLIGDDFNLCQVNTESKDWHWINKSPKCGKT